MNAEDESEDVEMTTIPVDSALLGDGEFVIFDMYEFCEATNSHAAMVRGPDMFVLQRDTMEWVNVKGLGKKAGKVTAINRADKPSARES